MHRQTPIIVVVFVSFACALTLGMLDKETQSLWHLLTADPANVVALGLYTAVFSMIGFVVLWTVRTITATVSESSRERPS